MSRYIVANRLRNNLFRLALFRKLLIPIPDFATNPKCKCGARFDEFGHHAFSPASKKQQQESPHNLIRDKSNEFLRPVLLQADYMFPGDEIETEKQGVCPSNNCNVKPFDASFAPRHPGCPYDDVNFDYTLISPSPLLPINPTTNDVSQQLSANAELHHQQGERTEEVQTGRRQSGRCCPLPLSEPPTSRGHW